MKTIRYISLACLLLLAFGCELLDDTSQTIAQRLEGNWKVDETPVNFKSTEDVYYVYIDIYAVDSNMIAIDKFFMIDGATAYASVTGMTLTLQEQEIGDGYSVYGSGTIAADFKKITWHYFVDEGSGTWHPVDATYTKQTY
jgi:hypothetical protein